MKKFIAVMVMALVAVFIPASAAQAITCVPLTGICEGGDLYHYSPDNGYDRDIIVFCDYGDPWLEREYVAEGSSSKSDCGTDMDQVYVRAGEEIWCADAGTGVFFKEFDAEGRHKVNDFWSGVCVAQVD